MAEKRMTYPEMREKIADYNHLVGRRIRHVKSGGDYEITGMHFREHDMVLCFSYCRDGSEVEFSRPIGEIIDPKRFSFGEIEHWKMSDWKKRLNDA